MCNNDHHQNKNDDESEKKDKSSATPTLPNSIESESGKYRIFPDAEEVAICIERTDGQPIPWDHEQFMESFFDLAGCIFAGRVGHGRFQIDISERAVRRELHVEIVEKVKEEL